MPTWNPNSAVTGKPESAAATIRVRGKVQGVGFRPFVYRVARERGITGWVRNDPEGVLIRAEGPPRELARFQEALRAEAPASAAIEEMTIETAPADGLHGFTIDSSGPPARARARMPHDLATCAACRDEVFDPHDRRAGYPFTNCTACGPRYSIIEGLPYDRPRTGMRRFNLCTACRAEYRSPDDRRFHAEPVACGLCGPRTVLRGRDGREQALGAEALALAIGAIRDGKVVALKGLGGYQLLVRADQSGPVSLLRARKGRPTKPLAVMAASIEDAACLGVVGPLERRLLASPENPIVLLERPSSHREGLEIASEVAPGLSSLGVFLPTTPLHHLLLAGLDFPIVVTSGNRSEEPIAKDEWNVREQIDGIADAFLDHDRPIVRGVDDSVVRVIAGRPVTLRLARGYAPLPLTSIERLAGSVATPVLATGGHQKVAVAFWSGTQAVLAQHAGDMDGASARGGFTRLVEDLSALYGFEPAALACDLHPDYFTTRWAAARRVPVIPVQHHHAHAAAAMVEHGLLDSEVLAVTWDGTGYGTDGTIWGGEVLKARLDGYERLASLRPFPLPGNEKAIRQPRRVALGLLALTLGDDAVLADAGLLARLGISRRDARTLLQMARRGVNTAWTSSVGRLFDAVAALLLGAGEVSHEGEAAAWLEAVADPTVIDAYEMPLRPPGEGTDTGIGDPSIPRGDWRPMVVALLADVALEVSPGVVSARFHNTLARWAAVVVAGEPPREVVLGGGCFQNRFLAERALDAIRETGASVHGPGSIPPGDGGLAAGQLAVAMSVLARRESRADNR